MIFSASCPMRSPIASTENPMLINVMHLGSYDDEPASVAKMDAFLSENGLVNDFSSERLHHEIYLSDARRVAPEKRKTVIRHPVKRG